MKIRIKDFGPINFFEFDLEKDFHLIVGENNVGKSYAITLVYLTIKSILSMESFGHYIFERLEENTPLSKDLISATKNSREAVSITDEAISSIKKLLEASLISNLQDSIAGTFESVETLSNQFTSRDLSIEIVTQNFEITIGLASKQLSIKGFKLNTAIKLKGLQQSRKLKITDHEIMVYYNTKEDSSLGHSFTRLIFHLYLQFLAEVTKQVKSIHYLPASRSGLYQALSAFGQIIAELSKNRSFISKKIELPGISEPLSDYFLKLSSISIKKKNFENTPFNAIAQKIENDILKGKVEFDSKTKRLIFLPQGTSLKLDLSTTSSMVSELSPIVSYLRHVLTETPPRGMFSRNQRTGKPLVIIEEPEAHLHPEIQIKMTEIFASLIQSDVKIIITSHSNYIFNKVNNLIISKKIPIGVIQASVFKMSENGSSGAPLPTDELGMDDENFLDAAEILFNEKINLINELNYN
jgi:hypothetical protein